MSKLNELDLAQLRVEFRRLYQDVGYEGSLWALYELIKSAEMLAEVIADEKQQEEDCKDLDA